MNWMRDLALDLDLLLPLLVALAVSGVVIAGTRALIALHQRRTGTPLPLAYPLIMLGVTALGIVVVVLTLPVSEVLRGQLLSLFGLVLTAVIAFSSTTFVANALAGVMLRAVGNLRTGDWIRVGDQFGRITERGLFHAEIQTEDHDLTTLPNLYLVTHPVVVVSASGTIVSASVSLGYDLDHVEIEALLIEAARGSGLEEPFVQIRELGDFSVRYRVAGFLADVKTLLSTRSRLRASILDTLHRADVEIVSPHFMNQRPLAEGTRFVPSLRAAPAAPPPGAPAPEERIFDKAEEQREIEDLRAERARLETEIGELKKAGAAAGEIERRQTRIEAIVAQLEHAGEKPPDAS